MKAKGRGKGITVGEGGAQGEALRIGERPRGYDIGALHCGGRGRLGGYEVLSLVALSSVPLSLYSSRPMRSH